MKYIDALKSMDKLLSDPKKHTVAAMARDKDGKIVPPTAKNAACWCLIGALRKVMGVQDQEFYGDKSYVLAVKRMTKALPGGILRFNDLQGYTGVKKFLRQQIKELG